MVTGCDAINLYVCDAMSQPEIQPVNGGEQQQLEALAVVPSMQTSERPMVSDQTTHMPREIQPERQSSDFERMEVHPHAYSDEMIDLEEEEVNHRTVQFNHIISQLAYVLYSVL